MPRWLRRLIYAAVTVIVLAAAAFWLLFVFPFRDLHPKPRLAKGILAIEHARIYTSPTDPPLDDAAVVIRDGRIAAVGRGIAIPGDALILACEHCIVTAGFWNVHVHFTEPKWSMAAFKPAAPLNAALSDMFLSRGFTTVVNLGSNPADAVSIRRRIERGELDGPAIYTAGSGIYPPNGIPYYLRNSIPRWMLAFMPQPRTPDEARQVVRRSISHGADVTKLFTGSWVERGRVLPMPLPIARAAVETTHGFGKPVFAHPSNLEGTRVAIDAGVDVLAHAADDTRGVDEALLASAVAHHMAMSPTLKMFATTVTTDPSYLNPIYAEVHRFHELGGTLLFGTDVGYMTDYSTEGEFEGLAKCGLTAMEVLAMLTTNPAARLGAADSKGTVIVGKLADLTVLDRDPAESLSNFSAVRITIRSGAVIYRRP